MAQQLLKELRNDNTEKVLELIQGEQNISYKDKKENLSGETPLFYCLSQGFWEGIKVLLQNGVDVNFQQDDGYTALHLAAAQNSVEAVKILTQNNADVNILCDSGTPIHMAIINGALESALIMIQETKQKLDFSLEDCEGNTIFHLASSEGHASLLEEILQLLLQSDQNSDGNLINKKNKSGNTLLHEAYLYQRVTVIDLLLKKQESIKLDINIKNKQGLAGIQIGKQLQKEEEEQKEQEVIVKRQIQEEAIQRQKQYMEEQQEQVRLIQEAKKKAVQNEESQKVMQEEIKKKGTFAMIVFFVLFFGIIYLLLKHAADSPSGKQI